ncbi:complex I subunit 5 family protein [Isoalcanivorax indicus]|uniref:complex I subunit 5 family protein n=1 Tax=Isoalcanivorax indicus TaxID=2202653 RepID=UPI000DBAC6E4|nr:complex I subunit 5 family protein [Isoalcanivorax indicus]
MSPFALWMPALTLALPLLLACAWALPARWHGLLHRLTALAPLPALLLALLAPTDLTLLLPDVLLGGFWLLDDLARALLTATALLWLLAGLYALRYPLAAEKKPTDEGGQPGGSARRFQVFWLLTLAGNLGLLVSRDIAGFYTCFALMTFAGYGLVVHTGRAAARRAGRLYLVMAVIGEMLILSGLILAASGAGAPALQSLPEAIAGHRHSAWLAALLWLGFGVKAGLAGLHMWLPLAHPVAPTPASAVLSGAMIKAGLLGWWLTLPLGLSALPWAEIAVIAALVAALGGALIGVTQQQAKAVLAYSSISQMGLITVMMAAGLMAPGLWPVLGPATLLYALHHALAKGALFLGVNGLAPRWRPLLWLPALSLAGLPLTTGAAAKLTMKAGLYELAFPGLMLWLSLAAVGTTLLMVRFMFCLQREAGDTAPAGLMQGATLAAVLASVTGVVWAVPGMAADWGQRWAGAGDLWGLVWPVGVGVLVGGACRAVWLRSARTTTRGPGVPAGDIVVLIEAAVRGVIRLWQRRPGKDWRWEKVVQWEDQHLHQIGDLALRAERHLQRWPVMLFVLLALILSGLLLMAR